MTNNDELALKLKQTAQLVHDNEQISNYGKLEAWKVRFRHTASPANILALLAERDADKKLIAELDQRVLDYAGIATARAQHVFNLEKRIAELETVSTAAEKLVRCKGRYHSEQNYRALAALFGVSAPDLPPLETEARTVSVKLPDCDYGAVQHMSGGSDDYCNGFVDGTQNAIKRVKADCAAAGIKLEVGE